MTTSRPLILKQKRTKGKKLIQVTKSTKSYKVRGAKWDQSKQKPIAMRSEPRILETREPMNPRNVRLYILQLTLLLGEFTKDISYDEAMYII